MKKNKQKLVKELATQFEAELQKSLPISIQPNGAVVYKQYAVKPLASGNWALVNMHNQYTIEEFYLKTTAIMAAKAYSRTDLNKFFEIKRLDNSYWAKFMDLEVYKKNIKTAKEFDRFQILLNKLEITQADADQYRDKISSMFKLSFA
jgi:hypothetical protein